LKINPLLKEGNSILQIQLVPMEICEKAGSNCSSATYDQQAAVSRTSQMFAYRNATTIGHRGLKYIPNSNDVGSMGAFSDNPTVWKHSPPIGKADRNAVGQRLLFRGIVKRTGGGATPHEIEKGLGGTNSLRFLAPGKVGHFPKCGVVQGRGNAKA